MLAGVNAASADAALTYGPCQNAAGFSCATMPVPLDRSGKAPGAISLTVERKAAGAIQAQSAVIALAGGPGQAAAPLGELLARAIAPALSTRDLLVFDQRGTGRSAPLNCPVFGNVKALESASESALGALVELCALQIGPARGAFTTQESVEDIESIRHTAGYKKLVLYGTSYGTKVALEYAERYPQHVEALVLDSVVPSSGPNRSRSPTFQAIGSVLGELCSNHACAGITSNPLGDLARLVARLRKHRLSGSAYDGAGHRHSVSLGELELLDILQAGDLNPALRALLPAAVRSALNGDPDPLLRLNLLAEGFIPNVPIRPGQPEAERRQRKKKATRCSSRPPARRRPSPGSAPPGGDPAGRSARLAARAAEHRLLPVRHEHSAGERPDPRISASWPDASAAPPRRVALPNVPTLILSGAQDLRTPTSGARASRR